MHETHIIWTKTEHNTVSDTVCEFLHARIDCDFLDYCTSRLSIVDIIITTHIIMNAVITNEYFGSVLSLWTSSNDSKLREITRNRIIA